YIVAAGFFAWAFFAPWGITGAEIGLAVIILGTLAGMALDRRLPSPRAGWALVAFFLIWAFAGASRSEPLAYSNLAHLWVLLMFYAASIHLDGQLRSRDVIALFLLSLTVCAVYSIIQHYTGLDLMHHDTQEKYLKLVKNWRYQVVGTYSHHLALANVMLAVSVLAFARTLDATDRKRFLWLAPALLMTTAMLFTFTHGPLLGLAVGVASLMALTNPRRVLPILGGVLVLLSVLFAISYNIRYFLLVQWAESVHAERLVLWKASLKLIARHPLFGVGAGNFRASIQPILDAANARLTSRAHAHNSLLQYAVEFGVPGAIFVFWLFARLLWLGLARLSGLARGARERTELAGYMAALVALIASSMTQHVFGDSEVALIAWLLCGAISAKVSARSEGSGAERTFQKV
ncbi:MAG TPA: O-antigen ligase domain-containing protein, partial [Proteobacteria bacterium]|nr:O-antigen ligase domain-containing protein [Pseudomonadota bacterium]